MLTTSTHDTKRSGDVGMRICLLSEIPQEWRRTVFHWSALNAKHRRGEWPDRNLEYFYYQTLVGAWPLPVERALRAMEKASREAKQHTSWTNPIRLSMLPCTTSSPARSTTPRSSADVERFVSRLPEARAHQLAREHPAEADRTGRARHLPGGGVVGPQPGRPR